MAYYISRIYAPRNDTSTSKVTFPGLLDSIIPHCAVRRGKICIKGEVDCDFTFFILNSV